jgi:phage gpG-like protein
MYTLLGMVAKLAQVSIETDLAIQIAIEEAAELVREKAHDLIGIPNGVWAALAESTLERKDGVNTPLLETGEMRASIEKTIGHHIAWVGSNNDKAVWQELGTSRIPPRSFIGLAARECEDKIHKIATQCIGRALAGHGVGGLHELLHALRFLGEQLNEIRKSFLERENPNEND